MQCHILSAVSLLVLIRRKKIFLFAVLLLSVVNSSWNQFYCELSLADILILLGVVLFLDLSFKYSTQTCVAVLSLMSVVHKSSRSCEFWVHIGFDNHSALTFFAHLLCSHRNIKTWSRVEDFRSF